MLLFDGVPAVFADHKILPKRAGLNRDSLQTDAFPAIDGGVECAQNIVAERLRNCEFWKWLQSTSPHPVIDDAFNRFDLDLGEIAFSFLSMSSKQAIPISAVQSAYRFQLHNQTIKSDVNVVNTKYLEPLL